MSLPASVELGFSSVIKNETGGGVDRRSHHLYLNDTEGTDVEVAIQWTDVDSNYGDAGIVEVFDSAGVMTSKYVASAAGLACTLTIPDGGKLLVRAQRPTVRAASAITLTDRLLSETGTSGDNLHDYSSTLTTTSAGLIAAADPVPILEGNASVDPEQEEFLVCTQWRADMIGQAAWVLDNQTAQGGIAPPHYGSAWTTGRGHGPAMAVDQLLACVHTLYCLENPYYGTIADRAKAALFWTLSRCLENGGLYGWDDYTGSYGLASAMQVPVLPILTFYEGMTSAEKVKVRNAIQIIGHANCILTAESTLNQSFHFIHNFAAFIKCWKHIRAIDGESDGDIYDYNLREMIRVMTTRTGYVFGEAGKGRAFCEHYGIEYNYGGLQRALIVSAIWALHGDDDLSDVRDGLIDLYDDQERFFDFARVTMSDGTQLVANGYNARQWTTGRQYGTSDSMRGISRFAARETRGLTDEVTTPVAATSAIEHRNWYAQRLDLEDAQPMTELAPEPLPSSIRSDGLSENGSSMWVRTPTYFIGVMLQSASPTLSHVNFDTPGDTDGERLGEAGEYGGPLSADVESNGVAFTTELSGTASGNLSGQGGIEAMSIRGVAVMASRNISPLTVHGIYADDGSRYYTADPNSQEYTLDEEAKTLTTTFELYTITGTFTRVLDWSNPGRPKIIITAPSDPGSGPQLYENVPIIDDPDAPRVAQIEGFSVQGHNTFGTEDGQPNIKWMRRAVAWGETVEYTIQEYSMSSIDLTADLKIHYEFDETAANSAPGGADFADSVGSNHLTDGGNSTYAQGTHGNVTQSFVQPSTASHPPRCAIGDMDWNIPTAGDFSIATWVYHPATHSAFERIWGMCNLDQSRGLNLKMDSASTDELYFVINGSGYITSGSTESLNKEQWNHVLVTHEHGVGLNLYINNVLSDTVAFASQILPVTTGGLVVLGEYGSGSSTLQNGGVAQFSIWEKVLTEDERNAHYGIGDGMAFSSYAGSSNEPRARRFYRERFSSLRPV